MKILFEGVDGAGKTTLSTWLAHQLNAVLISEPNHVLGGLAGHSRVTEHGGTTNEKHVATVRDIMLNPMVPTSRICGLTKRKPVVPYVGHDYTPLGRPLDPRISVCLTQANQAQSAENVRAMESEGLSKFVFDRSVISTLVYQGFAPSDAEMQQGLVELIIKSHQVTCTIDYDLTMILVGNNDEEERQIYNRILENRGGPEDDVYESAGFEAFRVRNRAYREVFQRVGRVCKSATARDLERFPARFGKIIIMSAHRPLDEMKKEVLRNVESIS